MRSIQRASRMLSSKSTMSGAIASVIVNGSGVGVATAAEIAMPRMTHPRLFGACAGGGDRDAEDDVAAVLRELARREDAQPRDRQHPHRDLEQQADAGDEQHRELEVVLGLQEDVERVVVEVLQEFHDA